MKTSIKFFIYLTLLTKKLITIIFFILNHYFIKNIKAEIQVTMNHNNNTKTIQSQFESSFNEREIPPHLHAFIFKEYQGK